MPAPEKETSISVGRYWGLVCHRRWLLIPALFLGWAAVIGGTWFLPKKYRSETLILVEQQKVPERYVEPNVAIDLQQRLQNLTQEILSRSRLLGIINTYGLYATAGRSDSDALVGRMRKDIQIELMKASQNQLSSFKVSYSAPTPQLAQQVTGALTALFIEDNLRNRQQLSEDTTAFLENQLQNARNDLAQQEVRLREFKGKYLGELPEQLQSNVQILSGLQSRMQAATEALNQAEQQKLYLDSLLAQYKGNVTEGDGPSISTLDQELDKLRNQLSDLTGRYTPQHPDIVRLKEQIAATEKLKQNLEHEAKANKKSDSPATTSSRLQASSPMMQIEGQVKVNDLNIANRKREIKDLEAQIRQYESRLNLTPVREQELAAVTRDYQQSRANYESLLAKKQQSEMATSLEKQRQGEQFRILDPPSLPRKPYFPDRFKMSVAGLGAGVALALALVVLFEIVKPLIYHEQDLRDLSTVPLLVGVPSIMTTAEQHGVRRRQWLEVLAGSMLLACMPILTALAYLKG